MGFLTNLGLAAGRNIITGQELQEKQEDIDLKKQQIAMGQIAIANAQRQQQTQQAVGSFLSSEAAKDASNVTDPVKAAGMLERGAQVALQGGDFVTANTMGELAKGKLQEAKEQAAAVAQQQQVKKEAFATAADDYAANPTPDGYKDLARKAIDAGENPTKIPMPGTPQFASWLNNAKLASKTASQRADFVQKAYEMDQNRRARQQEHAETEKRLLMEHRDNVMLREAMIQAKEKTAEEKAPKTQTVGDTTYEYDPSGKLQGDRNLPDKAWVALGQKMSSQQMQGAARGTYAAAEIHRTLANVLKFDPGTTTSPFSHLGASTPLEALTKVGFQKLTPAQSQALQVNAAGLGNFIASLDSAMGGRMAAGEQQAHLQEMGTPGPGDSGYTALYKVANAKEMAITALQYLPGNIPDTEKGKALINGFNKDIPFSTDDVIKMMKADPHSQKDEAQIRKLIEDSSKIKENIKEAAPEGVGLPGSGTGNAPVNVPPLPPGFKLDQ